MADESSARQVLAGGPAMTLKAIGFVRATQWITNR